MKMIRLAAIIAALVVVMGCASSSESSSGLSGVNTGGSSRTAKSAGGDELDRAIREISDYLNKRIPKGTKVVFLNVKSDYPDLSVYILDGLMENAVNDEVFAVVDRQQLDAIRSELNFQMSGEVSDASAQQIGQMVGAQTIVSGTVTTIGSIYRIQTRAIAVQTAAVQGQFSRNVDGNVPTITALTERKVPAGSSPAAVTPSGTRIATGTHTPATPTTYKIGDKGPAGGLIFYDKGNNNGGWRYMEAAPVEAEFQAIFSIHDSSWQSSFSAAPYGTTEESIGSGKRNTKSIVEKSRQITGEWDTAAQKVDELVFNGFDDWFLPSIDELDQMYGNLKRKDLDEFRNGFYWSSTDIGYIHDGYQGVRVINFGDGGRISNAGRKNKYFVRPIRQF
jgi:hypothetical protein